MYSYRSAPYREQWSSVQYPDEEARRGYPWRYADPRRSSAQYWPPSKNAYYNGQYNDRWYMTRGRPGTGFMAILAGLLILALLTAVVTLPLYFTLSVGSVYGQMSANTTVAMTTAMENTTMDVTTMDVTTTAMDMTTNATLELTTT